VNINVPHDCAAPPRTTVATGKHLKRSRRCLRRWGRGVYVNPLV
jgi:hypothetical protein